MERSRLRSANARRIDDDIECYCSTATTWANVAQRFTALATWQNDSGPIKGWNDLDSDLPMPEGSTTTSNAIAARLLHGQTWPSDSPLLQLGRMILAL